MFAATQDRWHRSLLYSCAIFHGALPDGLDGAVQSLHWVNKRSNSIFVKKAQGWRNLYGPTCKLCWWSNEAVQAALGVVWALTFEQGFEQPVGRGNARVWTNSVEEEWCSWPCMSMTFWCLVFTKDIEMKKRLENFLQSQVKMNHLGEAKFCLGLRITIHRGNGKLFVDQQAYTEYVLRRCNMTKPNPVTSPCGSDFDGLARPCSSRMQLVSFCLQQRQPDRI